MSMCDFKTVFKNSSQKMISSISIEEDDHHLPVEFYGNEVLSRKVNIIDENKIGYFKPIISTEEMDFSVLFENEEIVAWSMPSPHQINR